MHMKFQLWLFLSHRWSVRKEVNWSKPQWLVRHSWVRMSCWGRFFTVLITVVCVASLESPACCTEGCLGWFLFHTAVFRVKFECSSWCFRTRGITPVAEIGPFKRGGEDVWDLGTAAITSGKSCLLLRVWVLPCAVLGLCFGHSVLKIWVLWLMTFFRGVH